MFDIELSLAEEGGRGPSCLIIRRDWQELRTLHLSLTNFLTSSKKDVTLPPLPQYSEGSTDAEMAEEVANYLYKLMELPDVTSSRQFLSLIHDHDGAGGAEASGLVPENAIDFLLQPCAFTSLYVARRAKHEEEVEVPAGSTVLWRFMVGDGLDIQFKATFRPHHQQQHDQQGQSNSSSSDDSSAAAATSVSTTDSSSSPAEAETTLMEGRFPTTSGGSSSTSTSNDNTPTSPSKSPYQSREDMVQGSHTAPLTSSGGVCTLTWDNAYSRLRGKQVQYVLQVVTEEAMQAAMEAAEELSRASSRNRSLITARVQTLGGEKHNKGSNDKNDGKAVKIKVTPIARPALDATNGGNKNDELGIEEERERIVAGGRGGLGFLSSSSSVSSLDQALTAARAGAGTGAGAEDTATDTGGGAGAVENGKGQGQGQGQGRVRRSSLGVIWDYLYTNREDAKGEEAGGGQQQHQELPQHSAAELKRVVDMIEKMEDELAHMTAKKEQAEAEAVIALAKQRRWSIEKEKFERKMNEALAKGEQLAEQIKTLQREKVDMQEEVSSKQAEVEAAQEAAKRADRERDVLKAEKHVWTVAHSGVQAELTNLSGTLEKEKQAHEDTRAALKKAKEAAHRGKQEVEALKTRLEVKMDERTLQTAQEELASARAEIRDLSEALEETAAENDTLRGQMKLLARHVKQQKQEVSLFHTEMGQLRMRASTQEGKLTQLKAEKKLLVKELRALSQRDNGGGARGGGGNGKGGGSSTPTSTTASHASSSDLLDDDASETGAAATTTATGAATTTATTAETTAAEVPAASTPTPQKEEEEEEEKEEAETEISKLEKESADNDNGQENEVLAAGPPPPRSPPLKQQQQEQQQQQQASPPSLPPPTPPPAIDTSSSSSSSAETSFPILSPVGNAGLLLESDERYQRLLQQLRNVSERRKQLLLLLEEDPKNGHVTQLVSDLENVLSGIKGKMRAMMEAAGEGR